MDSHEYSDESADESMEGKGYHPNPPSMMAPKNNFSADPFGKKRSRYAFDNEMNKMDNGPSMFGNLNDHGNMPGNGSGGMMMNPQQLMHQQMLSGGNNFMQHALGGHPGHLQMPMHLGGNPSFSGIPMQLQHQLQLQHQFQQHQQLQQQQQQQQLQGQKSSQGNPMMQPPQLPPHLMPMGGLSMPPHLSAGGANMQLPLMMLQQQQHQQQQHQQMTASHMASAQQLQHMQMALQQQQQQQQGGGQQGATQASAATQSSNQPFFRHSPSITATAASATENNNPHNKKSKRELPDWLQVVGEACHSDRQLESGADLSKMKKKYKLIKCKTCGEYNSSAPWATLKSRKFEAENFADHERSTHHIKAEMRRSASNGEGGSSGGNVPGVTGGTTGGEEKLNMAGMHPMPLSGTGNLAIPPHLNPFNATAHGMGPSMLRPPPFDPRRVPSMIGGPPPPLAGPTGSLASPNEKSRISPAWLKAEGKLCHSDKQSQNGKDLNGAKKKYKKIMCTFCSEFNPSSPWATMKTRKFESAVLNEHERSHHHRKALTARELKMGNFDHMSNFSELQAAAAMSHMPYPMGLPPGLHPHLIPPHLLNNPLLMSLANGGGMPNPSHDRGDLTGDHKK